MSKTRLQAELNQDDQAEFRLEWHPRPLSLYEKQCMSGHAAYLTMVEENTIQSENQPSKMMQVSKKNRGPMAVGMKMSGYKKQASPKLKEALTEFHEKGLSSMYKFCQETYIKFGYQTVLGMYSSFKLARSSSTTAVAQKPKRGRQDGK